MTIVAEKYAYVIGVDTHSKSHTYAITDTRTGACTGCKTFPANDAGIKRAIGWIRQLSQDPILAAVEGTGSYGSALTTALSAESIPVTEAIPPKKKSRRGQGKSDPIDARAAATSVLGTEVERLIQPRCDGPRQALAVLLASRNRIDSHKTAERNALNALVRQIPLGLDTCKALTNAQIKQISAWRPRPGDTLEQRIAREEAVDLARSILTAQVRLKQNEAQLRTINEEIAPGFQGHRGLGPVSAAIILAAYSHLGRIRNEAAFAALAGVSPLQASSGNTIRHRLNRRGDRQLNRAMNIIAKSRMKCDPATKAFVERRTTEGKSKREITRVLKRYIARSIFRLLQQQFS